MPATTSLREALFAGAKEVFETMIFMSLEPCADAVTLPVAESILGTVTFKGGLEGCMGICCTMACAEDIARNMLGIEPSTELSRTEIYDAIGEVSNMIMGSLKTRIIENAGDIQVSIPSVVSGNHLDTVILEGQDRICVPAFLDEHIMMLSLLSKRKNS